MNPRDIPPEAFHASGAEVQALDFGYVRSPDQDRATPAQHPVVVIGAGPVGLSLAIDPVSYTHLTLPTTPYV